VGPVALYLHARPLSPKEARSDREAGIITLLLDERPTTAFTLAFFSEGEWMGASFRISLLVFRVEGFKVGKTGADFCARQTEVGGSSLVKRLCLFGLESVDLVANRHIASVEAMVSFDFCNEPPILIRLGFSDDRGVRVVVSRDEIGEPRREDVRDDVEGSAGLSI
jgi:hypothetical protein